MNLKLINKTIAHTIDIGWIRLGGNIKIIPNKQSRIRTALSVLDGIGISNYHFTPITGA